METNCLTSREDNQIVMAVCTILTNQKLELVSAILLVGMQDADVIGDTIISIMNLSFFVDDHPNHIKDIHKVQGNHVCYMGVAAS